MYNETLASFVDSGRIVSYDWAGASHWTGSAAEPHDSWNIQVVLADVPNIDTLYADLQTALNSTAFHLIDKHTGLNVEEVRFGSIVIRRTDDGSNYTASVLAYGGKPLHGFGMPDREAVIAEARREAATYKPAIPVIDQTTTPQSVWTVAQEGDAE